MSQSQLPTQYTLHEQHNSGNCYKIRLTFALLHLPPPTLVPYNILQGETRTRAFLTTVNPNGRIPVLQFPHPTSPSTAVSLPESNAAIHYLASTHNDSTNKRTLIPSDPLGHAQMLQWMFFEQYSHEPYIATARFLLSLKGRANLSAEELAGLEGKRVKGEEALDVMEAHLAGREWFVGDAVSLADVALFAYTHVAHEGGFDLGRWKGVEAWCERLKGLEGFVGIEE